MLEFDGKLEKIDIEGLMPIDSLNTLIILNTIKRYFRFPILWGTHMGLFLTVFAVLTFLYSFFFVILQDIFSAKNNKVAGKYFPC